LLFLNSRECGVDISKCCTFLFVGDDVLLNIGFVILPVSEVLKHFIRRTAFEKCIYVSRRA
jgi:hypothetical protein